jgi:hypothetical protein
MNHSVKNRYKNANGAIKLNEYSTDDKLERAAF